MKIAITADVHLKTREETPERYKALENIFYQLNTKEIDNLFIAGDLFDKDLSNYTDFDMLCKNFPYIKVTIIKGNHDYKINSRFFTASNLEIIDDIQIKELEGLAIVFIPYDAAKSIDEILSEYNHVQNLPDRWILIAHGDYLTGNRDLNTYEPGIYMPLTTKSIIRYNPLKVFLGHIHKPSNFGRVFYPGSPCSLDITETGKRKFLIYDTKLDSIDDVFVYTEKIYFDESIIMLPFEEEDVFLRRKFDDMIKNWGIKRDELNKVVLRLSVKGYVSDLKKTMNILLKIISLLGINLYDKEGLDLSGIKILKELEEDKLYLLERIREKIENLNISNFCVSKEKILEKSMELIFSD